MLARRQSGAPSCVGLCSFHFSTAGAGFACGSMSAFHRKEAITATLQTDARPSEPDRRSASVRCAASAALGRGLRSYQSTEIQVFDLIPIICSAFDADVRGPQLQAGLMRCSKAAYSITSLARASRLLSGLQLPADAAMAYALFGLGPRSASGKVNLKERSSPS